MQIDRSHPKVLPLGQYIPQVAIRSLCSFATLHSTTHHRRSEGSGRRDVTCCLVSERSGGTAITPWEGILLSQSGNGRTTWKKFSAREFRSPAGQCSNLTPVTYRSKLTVVQPTHSESSTLLTPGTKRGRFQTGFLAPFKSTWLIPHSVHYNICLVGPAQSNWQL